MLIDNTFIVFNDGVMVQVVTKNLNLELFDLMSKEDILAFFGYEISEDNLKDIEVWSVDKYIKKISTDLKVLNKIILTVDRPNLGQIELELIRFDIVTERSIK